MYHPNAETCGTAWFIFSAKIVFRIEDQNADNFLGTVLLISNSAE